jgi:hypothetical protein
MRCAGALNARAALGRQFQQALEHRRHPLAVRDGVRAPAGPAPCAASKRVHHVHGAAAGRDGEREKRSGAAWYSGAGREVAHVGAADVEELRSGRPRKGRRAAPVGRQQRPDARPWASRWCPRCTSSARPAARVRGAGSGDACGQQRLHGREAVDRPAQRQPVPRRCTHRQARLRPCAPSAASARGRPRRPSRRSRDQVAQLGRPTSAVDIGVR